jgi:hypothetical protein
MTKLLFRRKEETPLRTYKGKEYKNYRDYKLFLRGDFKKKCGYTGCIDDWFGGVTTFQIDHFLPKSIYPDLKVQYSNLIYSCSYVNRAKSNDEGNYLDPCDIDYNKHFYRNDKGEISPFLSSKKAVYMHKKLKLYLNRYSIIWTLEQLEDRMYKLQNLIELNGSQEAKDLFVEVGMIYNNYKKYLRA